MSFPGYKGNIAQGLIKLKEIMYYVLLMLVCKPCISPGVTLPGLCYQLYKGGHNSHRPSIPQTVVMTTITGGSQSHRLIGIGFGGSCS